MEKKNFLSRVKVAFVENNPEQLDEARWNLGPGVSLLPFLLSELQSPGTRQRLNGLDMLVTGVAHLQELKLLFENSGLPIIGISLQPKLEMIVRVAKLTSGRDLALVCETAQFAENVREALNQAGLYPKFKILLNPSEETLRDVLVDCGAVIVAPKLRLPVKKVLPENMECIEFRFEPDVGSLNLLRGALLEIKEGKH